MPAKTATLTSHAARIARAMGLLAQVAAASFPPASPAWRSI